MTDDRHPGLVALPGSAATLEPLRDGRHARVDRSKAEIIKACRRMMQAGEFRPVALHIAGKAGMSVRTLFQHFKTIEALHLEAIEDHTTFISIAARALPGVPMTGDARQRLVRAVVLGRVEA